MGNISIYGLYIKPWLFSVAVGFLTTFIFLRLADLTPARDYLSSPVVFPALIVIFSFAVWALFFNI